MQRGRALSSNSFTGSIFIIILILVAAVIGSYVIFGGDVLSGDTRDAEYRLQLDETSPHSDADNTTIVAFTDLTDPQQREFRLALRNETVTMDSQPELMPHAPPSTRIEYNGTLYDVVISVGH